MLAKESPGLSPFTSRVSPAALARLLLLSAVLGLAAAQAGAQFALDWYTVDGGGCSLSAGGSFALGGTVGQPDAGVAEGGGFTLRGGFWLGGLAFSSVSDPPPGGGGGSDPEAETPAEDLPTTVRVLLGRSNPFRHGAEIRLELPETSAVDARVFDHSGRLLRRLHSGSLAAGYHRLWWDGRDQGGRPLPSGVYLFRVQAGDTTTQRRLVLLK